MDLLIIFLFLTASLGHCILIIASHNWWYGMPLNRHLTDVVQIAHGLLMLAGPILFLTFVGLDPRPLYTSDATQCPLSLITAGYVALCWPTALLIFPAITVARHLRHVKAQISHQVTTYNIAEELGYKPVGDGKGQKLSQLRGNQVFQLDVTRREIQMPQIPSAWDGLSILHVSDLHFHGTPAKEYFQRVLTICQELEPDIIALTGDYVDSVQHHRWLIPLFGRFQAKIASFAILGNHDAWFDTERLRRRLQRAGHEVIGNSWTQIDVKGHPMVIIGNESPWIKPAPDLSACPENTFRLCLSHTPDNIRWAQRHQVQLMLAGHVHGGQIRLPVIGSILIPSVYGRRFDCGLFDEAPTLMHVTRGVSGKEPVRFNCRPEVALLVLRCETENTISS